MAKRIHYCNRARKVIFFDEIAAKLALAQRLRQDKGEIRYYQCPFSSHYHLTSEKKRVNEK